MTLTLSLPQELERRLSTEADRLGIAVDEYALSLLGAEPATALRPKTGAELVAYWQREGVIGSRRDIEDRQTYARELRRRAESRSREEPCGAGAADSAGLAVPRSSRDARGVWSTTGCR